MHAMISAWPCARASSGTIPTTSCTSRAHSRCSTTPTRPHRPRRACMHMHVHVHACAITCARMCTRTCYEMCMQMSHVLAPVEVHCPPARLPARTSTDSTTFYKTPRSVGFARAPSAMRARLGERGAARFRLRRGDFIEVCTRHFTRSGRTYVRNPVSEKTCPAV